MFLASSFQRYPELLVLYAFPRNIVIVNLSRTMSWNKPYHHAIRLELAQQRERVYGPSSDSVLELETSR